MVTTRDYRDLAIEHLTEELLDRDDALIEAIRDREGYRFLAYAAVERVADLTTQNDRLRHRVAQLVEEVRPRRRTPEAAA